MGPATLKFAVTYEDGSGKDIKVHISKDQDEADGMIMAIRAGKAAYKDYPIVSAHFNGCYKDD